MEKDALIKIILQDVRELDTLLTAFAGKPEISQTFIRLIRNRVKGILDGIDLLEYLLDTSESGKFPIAETEKPKPHETVCKEELEPEQLNRELLETIPYATAEIKVETEKPKVESNAEIQNVEATPAIEQKPAERPVAAVQLTVTETKNDEAVTLGEKLMQGSQSLYDTLTQKKESKLVPRFQSQPVKDIKSAIGINDRFYFQRELFAGNADLFNSIIEQLNTMNDMESADAFLSANFKWDNNNETVQLFKEIVKRRYL